MRKAYIDCAGCSGFLLLLVPLFFLNKTNFKLRGKTIANKWPNNDEDDRKTKCNGRQKIKEQKIKTDQVQTSNASSHV